MAIAINIFVMMTLFFAGMGQANAMDKHTAFWIAGVAGAVAMVLAIIRYTQRKKAGE